MKRKSLLALVVMLTVLTVGIVLTTASAAEVVENEENGNFGVICSNVIVGAPTVTAGELNEAFRSEWTVYDPNGNAVSPEQSVRTGYTAKQDGYANVFRIICLGDVNGDGAVDSWDYFAIKSHCLGMSTLDGAALLAADVNLDGTVDSWDYFAIKSHCLGMSNIFADLHLPMQPHNAVTVPGQAPTCTEAGLTDGAVCDTCGETLIEQEIVPALGHDLMHRDGKESTYTENGWEPYDTCKHCDYTTYRELPLKKKQVKILLIGNSYSADACDHYRDRLNHHSQTFDLFRSVLQEDVELQIGLVYSGGKTLAWHATKAYHDVEWGYPLYLTDADGNWTEVLSVTTHRQALAYTDWDFITLQPYSYEAFNGTAYDNRDGYGFDAQFADLKNSVPFMLDLIDSYAPTAKVYYYMHLAWANNPESGSAEELHAKLVKTAQNALTYCGTESGRKFEDVIAVGTALQNVRSTYLANARHNTTAIPTPETDVVINLQRDKHLSYHLGRYVAAMTFLKALVPKELLAEGALPCNIRECPDAEIGVLPYEYVEIIRKAAEASAEHPFAVTPLDGYEVDPAEAAKESIENGEYSFAGEQAVTDGLRKALYTVVGRNDVDISVSEITFERVSDEYGVFHAYVCIRFGYTLMRFTVDGTVS